MRSKSRSPDERLVVRQERSVPVLERIEKYLREQQGGALPKSQYGQAIAYALNHWEELLTATRRTVGWRSTTTSPKRTLRLCAISRKNWLFVGGDQGGETAAICFSILAGAKRHRIEPLAYVRAVLVALSLDEVDLESLLPDVWIKAHPEHFLKYRRDEAEAAAICASSPSGATPGQSPGTQPKPLRSPRCWTRAIGPSLMRVQEARARSRAARLTSI